MDSSVSSKDEIRFLGVCHNVSKVLYKEMLTTAESYAVGGINAQLKKFSFRAPHLNGFLPRP